MSIEADRMWTVRVDPAGLDVPRSCACCGDVAAGSRALRGRNGSVIVPYCDSCQSHASRVTTRNLSIALASAILGAALAAALPILLAGAHVAVVTVAAMVVAGLPVPLTWVRPRAAEGHTACGGAAWWCSDGVLACTSEKWARDLAVNNDAEVQSVARKERRGSAWVLIGAATALVATPSFHALVHPRLRVVNLTDDTVTLRVDGRSMGSVLATSTESPAAGIDLRLPAGERTIEVLDSTGEVVVTDRVVLAAGARHLYAPGAAGHCFWLETTRYGRVRRSGREVSALAPAETFWRLPPGIDAWFVPNPPPAREDARSTGGSLTALRQSPCAEAPRPVREVWAEHPHAPDLQR